MTAPPATASRLSACRLLGALAVGLASAALAGFITARISQAVAPDWAASTDRLVALIVGVVYLCVCLSLLLVLGRTTLQRSTWLALRPAGLGPMAAGLAIWAGAYIAAVVLYSLPGLPGLSVAGLTEVLWAVGADNGRLASASPWLTAIILIRICVLAPLAEELLFRGALFTWLRQRLSATWTILLTGIAFAIIHQMPAMLPLAALVGIAAGVIRERTGSATIPMLIHALQNITIVALSFLATGWDASIQF